VASADKMMVKAKGPVWHKKQRQQGLIPQGLRALDQEATWSYSNADGWLFGHGSYCMTTHETPVLGMFKWMPNSAHEAKRLAQEVLKVEEHLCIVCMDSKADDQHLYFSLKDEYAIQLLTTQRKGKTKTPKRQQMAKELSKRKYKKIYKQRSTTVEPMQALVKDIFDLDTCWMRSNLHNRWLFAAMGIAVQIAQLAAFRHDRSTWAIKYAVLGL
jgi:hypothetical protein